ncbi:MAG TPA: hypothetical protein VJC10_01655 [Patescibacteria group bacterium]|nr:hypothetical protein [Patescibacteria group bacterium]
MKNLFNTCGRCINPWVIGLIVVGVVVLFIVAPILGVASLVAALPLIGCVGMCGFMAFMMKDKKKGK